MFKERKKKERSLQLKSHWKLLGGLSEKPGCPPVLRERKAVSLTSGNLLYKHRSVDPECPDHGTCRDSAAAWGFKRWAATGLFWLWKSKHGSWSWEDWFKKKKKRRQISVNLPKDNSITFHDIWGTNTNPAPTHFHFLHIPFRSSLTWVNMLHCLIRSYV